MAIIKEFSASDFDKLSNICEDIDELYGEDYDWDTVDDWAEKAFESSREALGSPTTNTEKRYIREEAPPSPLKERQLRHTPIKRHSVHQQSSKSKCQA